MSFYFILLNRSGLLSDVLDTLLPPAWIEVECDASRLSTPSRSVRLASSLVLPPIGSFSTDYRPLRPASLEPICNLASSFCSFFIGETSSASSNKDS